MPGTGRSDLAADRNTVDEMGDPADRDAAQQIAGGRTTEFGRVAGADRDGPGVKGTGATVLGTSAFEIGRVSWRIVRATAPLWA